MKCEIVVVMVVLIVMKCTIIEKVEEMACESNDNISSISNV